MSGGVEWVQPQVKSMLGRSTILYPRFPTVKAYRLALGHSMAWAGHKEGSVKELFFTWSCRLAG